MTTRRQAELKLASRGSVSCAWASTSCSLQQQFWILCRCPLQSRDTLAVLQVTSTSCPAVHGSIQQQQLKHCKWPQAKPSPNIGPSLSRQASTARAVLLMRRLGEVGAPLPLAASAKQAVEKLFRKEPPSHHMDVLHDIFPMLKNKSKSSPSMGWSVD